MEFQFADFSTEAITQIGLNAGTFFFRAEKPAQLLFRLPCGGGINLGAFHSGEFEGLWSRFPGLKLIYPVTPQESFEAMIAGFYDPNPCLIFEHKQLYWGKPGDIAFDGNIESILKPRQYTAGTNITIVSFGAMVETVLSVINNHNYSAELWNPFILNPMNMNPIIESIRKTGRLLVVQESGETAGLGDKIISSVCRECFGALKRAPVLISAPDIPVPFAKELETFYLPGQDRISKTIEMMIGVDCE
jgi:2-oxoisovalerate dehydrogenase E1 component